MNQNMYIKVVSTPYSDCKWNQCTESDLQMEAFKNAFTEKCCFSQGDPCILSETSRDLESHNHHTCS